MGGVWFLAQALRQLVGHKSHLFPFQRGGVELEDADTEGEAPLKVALLLEVAFQEKAMADDVEGEVALVPDAGLGREADGAPYFGLAWAEREDAVGRQDAERVVPPYETLRASLDALRATGWGRRLWEACPAGIHGIVQLGDEGRVIGQIRETQYDDLKVRLRAYEGSYAGVDNATDATRWRKAKRLSCEGIDEGKEGPRRGGDEEADVARSKDG